MREKPSRHIHIQRAYTNPTDKDGYRVLVDHFWPRGRRKEDLKLAAWAREVSPTPALIKWFGHDSAKWPEFRTRYLEELASPAMKTHLQALLAAAGAQDITLVFGARNETENQAVVLQSVLREMDSSRQL